MVKQQNGGTDNKLALAVKTNFHVNSNIRKTWNNSDLTLRLNLATNKNIDMVENTVSTDITFRSYT